MSGYGSERCPSIDTLYHRHCRLLPVCGDPALQERMPYGLFVPDARPIWDNLSRRTPWTKWRRRG